MRAPVAGCRHKSWRAAPTPPDSTSQWYRCRRCGAFGFRKSSSAVAYKCGVRECRRSAADRLPGRGARLGMKWRCCAHMGEAILLARSQGTTLLDKALSAPVLL